MRPSNITPKSSNANVSTNNVTNFISASNQLNLKKQKECQSSVLNNSRSKSKNNNENLSQNTITNSSSNLKNSNNNIANTTINNNNNQQQQLKSSNSVNNFGDSKVIGTKKNYMKETASFSRKDYSTSNYENNLALNSIKDEKPRGIHASNKSINVNDKNFLDSISNLRYSPSPQVPFKKYSVSPNHKNPLESVIAENSDFFEEDNFDPVSYREKYLNNEHASNFNNYTNNNNNYNVNENAVAANSTQKITVRSSNTNVNSNSNNNNLLAPNQLKSLKSESKLLAGNNNNNNVGAMSNQVNGVYGNVKKTNVVKKNLNINNNNNFDPNVNHLVTSVKNINSLRTSVMNGSNSNFYQKNSNKNITMKDAKEQSKLSQNANLNIKTNKYKNVNAVKKNLEIHFNYK